MIKNKIYLMLAVIFLLGIIAFVIIRDSEATPWNKGDIIYYLTNNKIYRIVMPNKDNADVIFMAPGEKIGEKTEINCLSCGTDHTLIFHLTRNTGLIPDYTKADSKTTIALLDILTNKFKTLVDINGISAAFPVQSQDGTQLAMIGWDKKHKDRFVIIKDLKKDSIKYYYQFASISPSLASWSPDNKLLAMHGLDEQIKTARIYFFDIEKNKLIPWKIGKLPVFSPNGKQIAYVSPDHQKLIIADRNGKTILSFDGYLFKDISSWIGENRIIFTIGHFMYQNHIGIADLNRKKIYDIKIPTHGEINGVCFNALK